MSPRDDLSPTSGRVLPGFSRRGLLGLGLGIGATAVVGVGTAHAAQTRFVWQRQETQSWCSAAASRIALTAKDTTPPSQATLARQLGLSGGQGLQDPYAIARVLNANLNISGLANRYYFRQPPAGTLAERLRSRVVYSINNGLPVVINMNSVDGQSYSAGHYIAIVGYRSGEYLISDPDSYARRAKWMPAAQVVRENKLNRFTAFGN